MRVLLFTSSDIVGLKNGLWVHHASHGGVAPTEASPSNPAPAGSVNPNLFQQAYTEAKNAGRPTRDFDVTAVTASALPTGEVKDGKPVYGKLVYNPRVPALSTNAAVVYVRTADLDGGKLRTGVPVEPLILRAAAGDWIKVTLRNGFALNDPGLLKNPPAPTDPAFTTPQRLPYGTPFGTFTHRTVSQLTMWLASEWSPSSVRPTAFSSGSTQ